MIDHLLTSPFLTTCSHHVPPAESPRHALHVPPSHIPLHFPACHVPLLVRLPHFVSRDRHSPWSRLPTLPAAQAWALGRGLPEVLRGDATQVPLSRPLFKIVTSPWRRHRPGAAGPSAGGRYGGVLRARLAAGRREPEAASGRAGGGGRRRGRPLQRVRGPVPTPCA